MLAVALAFGAALGWGIADFLGGVSSRKATVLSVLLVSQVAALALLLVTVLALGGGAPGGRFVLYAVIAGLGETLAVAALYRGLAVGVMSIVAPVAAIAPAIPLAVGLALGESPTALQGAGLGLVIVGLVLTSRQRGVAQQAGGKLGPSLAYGLLSALGFGVFFAAMDAASDGGIPWALLVARLTAVSAVAAAAALRRSALVVRRSDMAATALIGVLIVAADAMYALATTLGLLGVVAVLGALHTVVTVALARVYLGERIERLQQAGIATCLCGVLAITAS
jgi:drug/metabolite transporter (DMT)-like permease